MAPDMRTKQNLAFLAGLALVVAIVSAPAVVAWGLELQNDTASGSVTKTYSVVDTSQIKAVYYVGTNTTGHAIKVDVTSQLNSTILDAASVNGAGDPGLVVTGIVLGQTGQNGANETNPNAPSELQFVLNRTVGDLLEGTVTDVTWTYKTDATGQYAKYVAGNATPVVTDYHTATSPDFGLVVGFAQGSASLVSAGGMTRADGSSIAGNYTRVAEVRFKDLAEADLSGKEFLETYDNPVVVKITGYKAGTGGNPSDAVRFSVRFSTPDSAGKLSYYEGFALVAGLYSIILWGGAFVASPWGSLRGFEPSSRSS